METLVIKCGGSVLRNNSDYIKIAKYIKESMEEQPRRLVCVAGAQSGVSLALQDEGLIISDSPNKREMDVILSTGELMASAKLALALNEVGCEAISLTGSQVGISTTDAHRDARIRSINVSRIVKELDEGKIVVVSGFQGIDKYGDVTTFDEGYGGSDLTAVLIAATLGCDCVLYKDVDGIYSLDPDVFPRAKKLDSLDYGEAAQMASAGGAVIEPYAVELAEKFGIEIYVTKIGVPFRQGSKITGRDLERGHLREVSNISIKENIGVTSICWSNDIDTDLSNVIFEDLLKYNVVADITVKEPLGDEGYGLSFSYNMEDHSKVDIFLEQLTSAYRCDVVKREYLSSVSLSGTGMIEAKGVVSRSVNALMLSKIPVHGISASDISITVIISSADVVKAIIALSNEFMD